MLSYLFFSLLSTSALARSLNKTRLATRDNECNQGLTKIIDTAYGPSVVCYSYCEASNTQITGPPQTVGSDITCDTPTCHDTTSQTVTVTQSFEINIGASGDSNPGEEDILKGGASVGASWSWSTATATSNSWTFDLVKGDAGHVVFYPYLQQSCGTMDYYAYDCSDDQGDACSCDANAYAEDTNACGATPIMNGNFAAGDFTFCYTGGPNAGTGC